MAINKKLINFRREEDFLEERNAGNILEKSIVFIDDTKKIYTHNTEFLSITSQERNKLDSMEEIIDDKILTLSNPETYQISNISLNPNYTTVIKTVSPLSDIVGNGNGTYNFKVKFHTFFNRNYVNGDLTVEINGVKNTVNLPLPAELSEALELEFNNVKYDTKTNLIIKLIPNWGASLEFILSDFTLNYNVRYDNKDLETGTTETTYETAEAVITNNDILLTKSYADKLYIQCLNKLVFVWVGTEEEYSDLASYDDSTIYIIKNDEI